MPVEDISVPEGQSPSEYITANWDSPEFAAKRAKMDEESKAAITHVENWMDTNSWAHSPRAMTRGRRSLDRYKRNSTTALDINRGMSNIFGGAYTPFDVPEHLSDQFK